MGEVFRFALLGLATGALYMLLATGLVLIYRGSGVVNFAHGAMGMIGTFVWWEVHHQHGAPFVVGLAAGLLVAAAIGVLTHYAVMRPLRGATGLTKVIATLAILVILQSVAAIRYPDDVITVGSTLPTGTWNILGANIGQDQVIIFLLVTVLVFILWGIYRFTLFGLATSAVAENGRSASALGLSPDTIAAVNWGVGAALAALAGILLAPINGLQATAFTLLIIPALAAAMFGGLTSFPLTMLGGMVIGIAQSEIARYVTAPGWSSAAPFICILIILMVTGRALPLRSAMAARLPSVGTGRVRPTVVIGVVVAYYLVVYHWWNLQWIDALNTQMITAIMLLSVVVITGYAGQLSLAQFAFAGLGALVAGRLVATEGVPFELAIVLGMVAVLPVGILVGLAGVRTRGVNLAVLTLLLAVAIQAVIFTNRRFIGGSEGTQVGFQKFLGIDVNTVLYPQRYAMLLLALFIGAALVVANLRRGRVGRRMIAVRSNERAASSLGISVRSVKLYAFALSSMIAALGGIMLAFRDPTIDYSQYDLVLGSIYLVQDAVVGGVGWLAGPVLGAGLYQGSVGTRVLDVFGSGLDKYVALIGGVLMLLTVLTAQDGIAFANWELGRRLKRLLLRRPEAPPARTPLESAPTTKVKPVRLSVADLTVRFGAVTAVSEVSIDVRPGEVVGLIGPNGAGKTTFIDAVTGFVGATAGAVKLDDHEITALSPQRRLRAGLARSFQSLELFDDMNVIDNLRAASDGLGAAYYLSDLVRPGTSKLTAATVAAIREFDLEDDLERFPRELSYGKRRLVAIARAVAAEPSVLLLDEPAAGLDDAQTKELGHLIRRLASDWGMAVLLVEHDVALVMSVCHRVCALNFGELIADGEPAEVRRDARVLESYLGTSDESPGEPSLTAGEAPVQPPADPTEHPQRTGA